MLVNMTKNTSFHKNRNNFGAKTSVSGLTDNIYGKTGLRSACVKKDSGARRSKIRRYFRKSFLTKKNRFIKMGDRQAVKKISSSRSALQRETGWCEVSGGGDEPALEPLWETIA